MNLLRNHQFWNLIYHLIFIILNLTRAIKICEIICQIELCRKIHNHWGISIAIIINSAVNSSRIDLWASYYLLMRQIHHVSRTLCSRSANVNSSAFLTIANSSLLSDNKFTGDGLMIREHINLLVAAQTHSHTNSTTIYVFTYESMLLLLLLMLLLLRRVCCSYLRFNS